MVFFKVENSYLLFFVKFMIWARKFLNSTIVVKCEIWAVQIKDSTIVKFVILAPRSSDSTIVESVVSQDVGMSQEVKVERVVVSSKVP